MTMTNLMQTAMVMLILMMIGCMIEVIKGDERKSPVYHLKQVQSRG
jgi:hypothetical protein